MAHLPTRAVKHSWGCALSVRRGQALMPPVRMQHDGVPPGQRAAPRAGARAVTQNTECERLDCLFSSVSAVRRLALPRSSSA